jgi:hypothetical protein
MVHQKCLSWWNTNEKDKGKARGTKKDSTLAISAANPAKATYLPFYGLGGLPKRLIRHDMRIWAHSLYAHYACVRARLLWCYSTFNRKYHAG